MKLSACVEGGCAAGQEQEVEVRWAEVRAWRPDDDAAALTVHYGRRRPLTLHTPYVSTQTVLLPTLLLLLREMASRVKFDSANI